MNDPKDRLSTRSNKFAWRDRYVLYHVDLCARWDLVDLNDISNVWPEGDPSGYTFHKCVYLRRISVICAISTV